MTSVSLNKMKKKRDGQGVEERPSLKFYLNMKEDNISHEIRSRENINLLLLDRSSSVPCLKDFKLVK